MSVYVTKADGVREMFDVQKLRRSLKRAGATNSEITTIILHVEEKLYDGIPTQIIYREAFAHLRSMQTPTAARYSMRRALFSLGPTGFPFEDFLARLFQAEGYQTKTRLTLKGKCALHELDVAAYNQTDSFVVEAKFHSRPGVKSDLQVALYTNARRLDLVGNRICAQDVCGITRLIVVTNTKFTTAAEKYAECAGLELLSWNYPKGNNLHQRIERAGIYPITTLASLSQHDKRILIEAGLILCVDIVSKVNRVKELGLSNKKIDTVLSEIRQLCKRN